MIEIIESVVTSKIKLDYSKDMDAYVSSTENVLGNFSSVAKTPDESNRRLRAKLFSLIANYVMNQKVSH
ncbi:MAG: hypothetical protein EBY16_08770 [Gammaproteobacteria bacterium]|nr:hypothetical protein [Gammaproteobacteria bacterium]